MRSTLDAVRARIFRRALPIALLIASCEAHEAPRWIDVVAALGDVKQHIETRAHTLPDGKTVRVLGDGAAMHLELALDADDWQAQEVPGFWLARPALLLTGGRRTSPAGFELRAGERAFTPAPGWELKKGFAPYCFFVSRDGVLIHLPKGERPAPETTLSVALHGGAGGAGRVFGRRFSGRGFQVWPSQTVSLALELPEHSALHFATTLEPLLEAGEGSTPPVVFRVLLDGQPIFEHVVAPTEPSFQWHRIALPRAGRAELAFETRGSLALSCFLDPAIGPAEIGSPGARPWDEEHPDVILFLADTFRADNLGAYGSTLELTPNLDRLAAQSLRFERAWSVGTYTLPSHVSIFTGILPYEAGLRTLENALPENLRTIAEELTDAGYRTGAITDAGIVSRRFAFDQGFGFFDERDLSLESTLERARAFLDADDGRPVFLFAHTYRVHAPYRVSDETRRQFGERLGIQGEYAALERALFDLARTQGVEARREKLPPAFLESAAAMPLMAQLRAQYLGGVADLDRGFGAFRADLEQRRFIEHGVLIFTSDHGEAFGEHGEFQHGDKVFEAKTRIPLLVAGHGIAAGVVANAASLVDLTPTIAALARIAPRTEWRGTSLLALDQDRPVFSFGFDNDPTFAVVEGARKVIGFQAAGVVQTERMLGAFDLTQDPHEERDLNASGAAWPAEMLRRYGPAVERALVPSVATRAAVLAPEDLDELGKLGYGNR